jgi:hypothetical protein
VDQLAITVRNSVGATRRAELTTTQLHQQHTSEIRISDHVHQRVFDECLVKSHVTTPARMYERDNLVLTVRAKANALKVTLDLLNNSVAANITGDDKHMISRAVAIVSSRVERNHEVCELGFT